MRVRMNMPVFYRWITFIPEAWNLNEHPSAMCGTFPIDQGGPKAPQIMQIINIPLSFTPQLDCMT